MPALKSLSSLGSPNSSFSDHPQVAQDKLCYQLSGVLGQPFVANLGETKLTFENSTGMFRIASDAGLELFGLVTQVAPRRVHIRCPALSRAYRRMPIDIHSFQAFLDSLGTDLIGALNSVAKDVAGAGDSRLIASSMTLTCGGTVWETAFLGSLAAAVQVGSVGNTRLRDE